MNAVQIIRVLELENYELRAKVGQLAKRIDSESYHARRIEQAYKDALLLALWAGSGVPPSRRYARRQSMSQRRWENAVALLRLARVLTGNRRWTTTDAAIIEQRLTRAAKTAIDNEDAYLARHVAYHRRP